MTDKSDTPELFSAIARRYDLLNHLLSMGADRRWRRALVDMSCAGVDSRVLDAATGTGDVALEFARRSRAGVVVGLDRSAGMLGLAAGKVSRKRLNGTITLVEGDAIEMPFDDGTFDVVTIAFGLRNLPDYAAGLGEMTRVLKSGGRLFVLEFFPPRSTLFLGAYRFYLNTLIPVLGGVVSGSAEAYRYLADSIKGFLTHEEIRRFMRTAGLTEVRSRGLSGGVAHVYRGVKR